MNAEESPSYYYHFRFMKGFGLQIVGVFTSPRCNNYGYLPIHQVITYPLPTYPYILYLSITYPWVFPIHIPRTSSIHKIFHGQEYQQPFLRKIVARMFCEYSGRAFPNAELLESYIFEVQNSMHDMSDCGIGHIKCM